MYNFRIILVRLIYGSKEFIVILNPYYQVSYG